MLWRFCCLQAQQAFQATYPQLAEQHSQVLAAALNNSAGTHSLSAADAAVYSTASKLCNTEAAAAALLQSEKVLAAAGSSAAVAGGAAAATTASQVGLTGVAGGAGGDGGAAAAAAGPVQALLQLAATAGSGLYAVDKVCGWRRDAVTQSCKTRVGMCCSRCCCCHFMAVLQCLFGYHWCLNLLSALSQDSNCTDTLLLSCSCTRLPCPALLAFITAPTLSCRRCARQRARFGCCCRLHLLLLRATSWVGRRWCCSAGRGHA
jgi:hypothetical protein